MYAILKHPSRVRLLDTVYLTGGGRTLLVPDHLPHLSPLGGDPDPAGGLGSCRLLLGSEDLYPLLPNAREKQRKERGFCVLVLEITCSGWKGLAEGITKLAGTRVDLAGS